MSIALPVSFECHGIRHGLAARVCQVAVSVSAVIPTPSGIGPIPNAFGGLISIFHLSIMVRMLKIVLVYRDSGKNATKNVMIRFALDTV